MTSPALLPTLALLTLLAAAPLASADHEEAEAAVLVSCHDAEGAGGADSLVVAYDADSRTLTLTHPSGEGAAAAGVALLTGETGCAEGEHAEAYVARGGSLGRLVVGACWDGSLTVGDCE